MTLDAIWGMFPLNLTSDVPMDRSRRIYLVILSGALLWCAAIVSAPLIRSSGGFGSTIASVLYQFFQPVCHQIDGRSLHMLGEPLAVCVRCSSIYGAFLLGTILYPLLRPLNGIGFPSRWLLLGALVPMLLDVAAGITGLHEITPLTRTVTGIAAGITFPFYVIPVAIEAFAGSVRLLTRPEPLGKEQ